MNFINIIEGIERLVVSLLFWIIFIPKSIYKIVTNPKWVSEYVRNELEKDSDRFKDYMSPIILYLLNSVFLSFVYIFIKRDVLKEAYPDEWVGQFITKFNFTEDLLTTLSGSYGILAAAVFMSFPLFFALIIGLIRVFKGENLTRESLRYNTYVQCYYFSPLILSYALIVFSSTLLEEIEQFLFVIIFLAILLWFVISEIKVIKKQLGFNTAVSGLLLLLNISSITAASLGILSVIRVFDEDKEKVTGVISKKIPVNSDSSDLEYKVELKCIGCPNEDLIYYYLDLEVDEKIIYDRTKNLDSLYKQIVSLQNVYKKLKDKPEAQDQLDKIDFEIDSLNKIVDNDIEDGSKIIYLNNRRNIKKFTIPKKDSNTGKDSVRIDVEVGILNNKNYVFYTDILDDKDFSIIGGIRSKQAMNIRKGISYFLLIFMGIIVVLGIRSFFLKDKQ